MKIPWTVIAGVGSGGGVFLLAIAFSIVVTEGRYKAARNISLALLAASCTTVTTTAVATVADRTSGDRRPQQSGPKPIGIPLPTSAEPPVPVPIDLGPRKHPYEMVRDVLGDDLGQQLASISVQIGATNPINDERAVRLFDSTTRLIEAVDRHREPAPAPTAPPPTEDEIDLPDVPRGESSKTSPLVLEDEWFSGPEIQPPAQQTVQHRAYPPEFATYQPEQPAPVPPAQPVKKSSFGGFPLL